jgi:pilus assembly protein CpaF
MVASRCRVISIIGSKGGVGATVFVRDLALALSQKNRVLMLDADLVCQGDLAALFDMLEEPKELGDVKDNLNSTPNMLNGYLNVGVDNVGLVNVGKDFQYDDKDAAVMRHLLGGCDYLLIEAGSTADATFKPLLSVTNKLVVVSGNDISSVSSAERMLKYLGHMGLKSELIDLVIKPSDDVLGMSKTLIQERVGRAVDRFISSAEIIKKYSSALGEVDSETPLLELGGDGSLTCPESHKGRSDQAKTEVLKRLSSSKEVKRLVQGKNVRDADRAYLEDKIKDAVDTMLNSEDHFNVGSRKEFIKDVIDEAIGLGPLEKYMSDPEITEVMINAFDEIYIEKNGKVKRADAKFASSTNLTSIIERIVSPIGRRVDESSPIVDARLPDGSRVHIVIPPLSLKGPTITIRKFRDDAIAVDDLVSFGSLSYEMSDFLKSCVERRVGILISGGTGTGKTTFLNVLSSFISEDERIVTIEDSAELKLVQPHVVRLESRPSNIEGRGEVTIRDLVKASLRMRPDRIIVGEVRGAEALDMLQAMNTGHDGSITTVHANSARDSVARLETLILFAGFDLPVGAVRKQISSAINIIIHLKRFVDGSRKVVTISEITGMEGQTMTMQELFVFDGGEFVSTGFRPKFLDSSAHL